MGDWIYYITFMKMRFVAQRVRAAEEIHKSETLRELIQRTLDASKHGEQIKNYLLKDKQRFFNSLVIGVYRGAPEWHELEVETWKKLRLKQVPSYLNGAFGILTLRGDEKLFAIDGQHRAVGIRMAVQKRASLGDDEVSAIFVGHKEDMRGRQRTRRLFTRLNRFAKPVRKEEIIALDEDDVIAILTREFVEDDVRFQDKISIRKTKALPPSDKSSFTTISAFYDCLDAFLKIGRASWSDFKRVRPTDREIKAFRERASSMWSLLARIFPEVRLVFESRSVDCVAGQFRHVGGGHLLFRPVGLQLAIEALAKFVGTGVSATEALKAIARVPMELRNEPWAGLLWDNTNRRMITQAENQKVALKVLYFGAGGDLSDFNTEPKAVRKELAGLLHRPVSRTRLFRY
jgi:DNA sulfur modification protein DndB